MNDLKKTPDLESIREQAQRAAEEIVNVSKLQAGDLFVVGCSSSEVQGERIGTDSSAAIGQAIFEGVQAVLAPKGIHLAAQCCEHLNRALIVSADALVNPQRVNVVPQPDNHAGGAFATAAYHGLKDAIAVETIQADAGMDIGNTLIGMHLKAVAVPVRLKNDHIGVAPVVAARVRPKYIGGPRAIYDPSLL